MANDKQVKNLVYVGIITAFATLAFVGTTILRIPIPTTGGYFNLGDTFVMIGALLYGPIAGLFVGLIGPTVSDGIGFPQFMLATAVVKAAEGLFVGLIGLSLNRSQSYVKAGAALILGVAILVVGYFVFEALVYPFLAKTAPFFGVTDFNAAIGEMLPNAIQGVLSAIIAFGIWRVLKPKTRSEG
jgi:uncharacterized membrane protein